MRIRCITHQNTHSEDMTNRTRSAKATQPLSGYIEDDMNRRKLKELLTPWQPLKAAPKIYKKHDCEVDRDLTSHIALPRAQESANGVSACECKYAYRESRGRERKWIGAERQSSARQGDGAAHRCPRGETKGTLEGRGKGGDGTLRTQRGHHALAGGEGSGGGEGGTLLRKGAGSRSHVRSPMRTPARLFVRSGAVHSGGARRALRAGNACGHGRAGTTVRA
eukprot:6175995-Pleurochrysis_carterae.AAC.3